MFRVRATYFFFFLSLSHLQRLEGKPLDICCSETKRKKGPFTLGHQSRHNSIYGLGTTVLAAMVLLLLNDDYDVLILFF